MKILYFEGLPPDYHYDGDPGTLLDCFIDKIRGARVDVAAYWYASGLCEGTGQLITRKDGKWGLVDLGHSSDYDPLDEWDQSHDFDSLDEMIAACSYEYALKQVQPLVNLLRANGYE